MFQVVFIRHGQSVYNKKGLFTGWVDSPLTRKGKRQAKKAGKKLKKAGYVFDVAFCSQLKRAKETLQIVLQAMGLKNVAINYSPMLNERHYGLLQGVNKKQAVQKYGYEEVFAWRRSFKIKPPADGEGFSESLEDTQKRVLAYWQEQIKPQVLAGKKVFVSCHGSTLRALIKHFDNISDKDIEQVNAPLGIALVYEFDTAMQSVKSFYLGDTKEIKKAQARVALEIGGKMFDKKI